MAAPSITILSYHIFAIILSLSGAITVAIAVPILVLAVPSVCFVVTVAWVCTIVVAIWFTGCCVVPVRGCFWICCAWRMCSVNVLISGVLSAGELCCCNSNEPYNDEGDRGYCEDKFCVHSFSPQDTIGLCVV